MAGCFAFTSSQGLFLQGIVGDKLCVIEKLEKRASLASICVEYGITKQTVLDIKKKDDLRRFVLKFNAEKM